MQGSAPLLVSNAPAGSQHQQQPDCVAVALVRRPMQSRPAVRALALKRCRMGAACSAQWHLFATQDGNSEETTRQQCAFVWSSQHWQRGLGWCWPHCQCTEACKAKKQHKCQLNVWFLLAESCYPLAWENTGQALLFCRGNQLILRPAFILTNLNPSL